MGEIVDKTILFTLRILIVIIIALFLYVAYLLATYNLWNYALSLVGVSVLLLGPLFFVSAKKIDSKRFLLLHGSFALGLFLSIQSLKTPPSFDYVDAFLIGSFSMVITATFYLRAQEEFFRNLLTFSVTSSFLLFVAGFFNAIASILGSGVYVGKLVWIPDLTSALFLLGALDLVIISILFFAFIISSKRPDYIR